MPDIKNEEKDLIRKKAQLYSKILTKMAFKTGVSLNSETISSLSMDSARYRLCLLCGGIGTSEEFKNHHIKCSHEVLEKIPLIVKTSWYKLRDFFLSEEFLILLRQIQENPSS